MYTPLLQFTAQRVKNYFLLSFTSGVPKETFAYYTHMKSGEWKQSLCSLIYWFVPTLLLLPSCPPFTLPATIPFAHNSPLQPDHTFFLSSASTPTYCPVIAFVACPVLAEASIWPWPSNFRPGCLPRSHLRVHGLVLLQADCMAEGLATHVTGKGPCATVWAAHMYLKAMRCGEDLKGRECTGSG